MRDFFVKLSRMDRRWVFLGVALTTDHPIWAPALAGFKKGPSR